MYKSNFDDVGVGRESPPDERVHHPDVPLASKLKSPFYNAWRKQAFHALNSVRPPVFYVYGSKSRIATPQFREEKMQETGVGFGGSGGAKDEQVGDCIIPGGHFLPMECPQKVATEISTWLGGQMVQYRKVERQIQESQRHRSVRERQMMSSQWLETVKNWDGKQKQLESKL